MTTTTTTTKGKGKGKGRNHSTASSSPVKKDLLLHDAMSREQNNETDSHGLL